jgi:C-terminal processing protease CtpA/Prc
LGFTFTSAANVAEVIINSPAHKAGLMFGDKIKSINGVTAIDKKYFNELIKLPKGTPLNIVVERRKKKYTINCKIYDYKSNTADN